MRKTTTALFLATALLFPATRPASAQDKPKADASADAAEEAFLKAYFAEKELKDYAAAEKAYAVLVESPSAQTSHEVTARALLGRARCLVNLKRADDAQPLFARVEKEFADVADAAKEARDARQTSSAPASEYLSDRILADLDMPTWRNDVWKYGERGVPTLARFLRNDSPERVFRAAESLARMENPAAHEALAAAIDARSSTYPEQVRDGATNGWASYAAARRLSETKDAVVRTRSLQRLVYELDDPKAVDLVLTDAELRKSFLATTNESRGVGRLLVTAIARGGEARAQALERLRGKLDERVVDGMMNPPEPLLADSEALTLLARHVTTRNVVPSAALTAAFLRRAETSVVGVRETLARGVQSDDPSALVAAIGRNGFGVNGTGSSWGDHQLADALVAALGPKPSPELLRKLAAAWPEVRDNQKEGGRFSVFVQKLIASGVADEQSLLALQDGLRPEPDDCHVAFVRALQAARTRSDAAFAWAAKAFLKELERRSRDNDANNAAAAALNEWQAVYGDALGLEAHVPEIVAALGFGGSDQLMPILDRFGQKSVAALRAALPTHPHKDVVVEALVRLGDKSSADAIERVLVAAADIEDAEKRTEEVTAAVKALATLRGDAAKDAIAAALLVHGGRDAEVVLCAVGEFGNHGVAFGAQPKFEICKLALEKCPDVLESEDDAVGYLTPEMKRELAILALRSSSVRDRRWGADAEKDLLDVGAWDALLVTAQDSDNDVRDLSREALRAIRAKELEMAEFRTMGEERETRKRIEQLVRNPSAEQRRAGVAAIAATGIAGMVNELIRLASEDQNETVREDARKALLAMAKQPTPAPQPSPEKK